MASSSASALLPTLPRRYLLPLMTLLERSCQKNIRDAMNTANSHWLIIWWDIMSFPLSLS